MIIQLLYNRGIQSQSDIDLFFEPAYNSLHDPFRFKDMERAVARIIQAIEGKEKILIHGDYDADGVTSSAVLYRTFKLLGADVETFIPHRENDGYGINIKNVNNFVVQGVQLFITVDCGITNVDEVALLNEKGVDVIITDHHEPPDVIPDAYAILDPKVKDSGYPFRELAGAGVAYKLVQAILSDKSKIPTSKFQKYGGVDGYQKWILDIVAIGTVADVAPLVNENRILVKWGLVVLAQTKWPGLKSLLNLIKPKNIDSFTIGFQIAPRLNAAGRLNHAELAYRLLVTEDNAEADKIANELQENNVNRQRIIEKSLAEAKSQIESIKDQKVIFAFSEDWRPGIIGLIAGRLSDEFYRPVLAMTVSGDKIIGSGRSIDGFDMIQSLRSVESFFARYGGHAGACGFTLAEIPVREEFEKTYYSIVEKKLAKIDLSPSLWIDREIEISEISFDLLKQIMELSPFGEGNDRPLFKIKNLQITSADRIGKLKTHLRMSVKQHTPIIYKMLWFGKAEEWFEKLKVGATIDVVCELGINEWNGSREFEFKIQDLKINDK